MELAVRLKLEELIATGAVLGAQVCVLCCDKEASRGWQCNVAAGRSCIGGLPVTETTLLPLLDVGLTVLVTCLLAALARPTAAGQVVGLETTVARIWPDFGQRGKGSVTVSQLLQHRAGLSSAFSRAVSSKSYLNEQRTEEVLAGSPQNLGSVDIGQYRVLGASIAAILRRIVGKASAAEALQTILEPLSLHESILYSGREESMAHLGRRPRDQLPLVDVYDWFEEVQARQLAQDARDALKAENENKGRKASPWVSWREFTSERPGCADPLVVNGAELRSGKSCLAGRGLRASAQALCRLLASDMVPSQLLERSRGQPRTIQVETLEDWQAFGECLDISTGWQLLRLRPLDSTGAEVIGHGYIDGSTGSISLRIHGASVVVLLTSVQKDSRRVAREVLTAALECLGLEPVWHLEVPKVPARANLVPDAKQTEAEDLRTVLGRMEAQIARLTQALEAISPSGDVVTGLAGSWASAETDGLDVLFDTFDIPIGARAIVERMSRTLQIEVVGDKLSISSSVILAGRTVGESVSTFSVGKPFEGEEQLGGHFKGLGTWISPDGADNRRVDNSTGESLMIEKRFEVGDREVVLEELYEPTDLGRLMMTITLRGTGERTVPLHTVADRDRFCRSLEPEGMRLRKEVKLGCEQLWRGGKIVSVRGFDECFAAASTTYNELSLMPVPGYVTVLYGNTSCSIAFDRKEAGQRSQHGRGKSAHSNTTSAQQKGRAGGNPDQGMVLCRDMAGVGAASCTVGLVTMVTVASSAAATALHSLARALKSGCTGCSH